MPGTKDKNALAAYGYDIQKVKKHLVAMTLTTSNTRNEGSFKIQNYIVKELNKLGLEVEIQRDYSLDAGGHLTKSTNILTKIAGSHPTKSLVLIGSYDSDVTQSNSPLKMGSIAILLETIRAYKQSGILPKNDIILLISDTPEAHPTGSILFLQKHQWAKKVGLAINLEARGMAGPSQLHIETNRGNAQLVNELIMAKVTHPITHSIVHCYQGFNESTVLKIFKNYRDIDGFHLGFFDNTYRYNTTLDTIQNLDDNVIAHQASYLMPLLQHFSQIDLTNLKHPNNRIFFSFPWFKMVHYPEDWAMPIGLLCWIVFLIITIYGIRHQKFRINEILIGLFISLFLLVTATIAGYCSWPILTWWYPWFNDMPNNLPYNAHDYIGIMSFFMVMVSFFCYYNVRKAAVQNLLIAPILLGLLGGTFLALKFKGSSFIALPIFGLLGGLFIILTQKRPHPWLQLLLALPSIFIIAPLIRYIPIGLGLDKLMASTLFTVVLLFTLIPYFAAFKFKLWLTIVATLIFLFWGIKGHLAGSDFTEENPKPSSLVYFQDQELSKAFWLSHDYKLSDWNQTYFKSSIPITKTKVEMPQIIKEPKGHRYVHVATVPKKQIPKPHIYVTTDTLVDGKRTIEIVYTQKRNINKLEIYTSLAAVLGADVNGVSLDSYDMKHRAQNRLITHHIHNNDSTVVRLTLQPTQSVEFEFYETSNDLLIHPQFSIAPRPKDNVAKNVTPNDAIITLNRFKIE